MNARGGADDEVNKRKQASEEVVKVTDKDQPTQKKPRYIWTRDVHNCFLDAIKQLGFKAAVPTKILELMNVEDLTRENVASHLQKYRLQVKRRDQERAQARCASENVLKAVYPHMSGIPQQPWVLPNTMQGINMDCADLYGSQQAPSFANHNLNMIQGFPTVHGTPFKDFLNEGVDRMSGVRLVHGLYDSNGPRDINKIVYDDGSLPLKPLVDSYAQNLMDHHDTTLIPQYDRRDDLSRLGVGVPCPSEAIGGLIEMKVKGLGIGMPRPPTGVLGRKLLRLGLGMSRLPEATGIKVEGHVTHPPEAKGGFVGLGAGVTHQPGGPGFGVPCPPEAIGGLIEMKVEELNVGMPCPPTGVLGSKFEEFGLGVPLLPEATGIKVEGHVTCLPEAKGGFVGLGEGVTHQPGGPGFGSPRHTEASGGLSEMNDLQKGFSFELESDIDFNDVLVDMKGDVDGKSKSFEVLYWRS